MATGRWVPPNKAGNPFAAPLTSVITDERRLGVLMGNVPDDRTTVLDLSPVSLPKRMDPMKLHVSYPPGGNNKPEAPNAKKRNAQPRQEGMHRRSDETSPAKPTVKSNKTLKPRTLGDARRYSHDASPTAASYRRRGDATLTGSARTITIAEGPPPGWKATSPRDAYSTFESSHPVAVAFKPSAFNQNPKLPPPPSQAALMHDPPSHSSTTTTTTAAAVITTRVDQPMTPMTAAMEGVVGGMEREAPSVQAQREGAHAAGDLGDTSGTEVWGAVGKLVPGATKEQWGGTMKERQTYAVDEELKHFLKCCQETGFLNLTHNNWNQLPKQVEYFISDFGHRLRTLNLEGNNLEACPELGSMPQLASLNLSHNRIKSIPASIAALAQLTSLSLDKNGISALPNDIGSRTTLTYLDASHNELQWLPESFARLTKLRTLKINNNLFSHVPHMVTSMSDLMELNASHNSVTGIPAGISNLHKLQFLRLDHNRLASLPHAIGGLWRSLAEFDLSENELSQLPSSLGACRKLQTLDLSLNPLQFPPLSVVEQGTEAVLGFLSGASDKMMFDSRYNNMQARTEAMGEKSNVGDAIGGTQEDTLAQRIRDQVGDFCIDCGQMAFDMAMNSEECKIQLKAQNRQLRNLLEEKERDLEAANNENQLLRNKIVETNKMMRMAEKALRDAMQGQTQLLEKTVLQGSEIELLERKLAKVTSRYEQIQAELKQTAELLNQSGEAKEGEGEEEDVQPIKVAEIVKANNELTAALAEARQQAAGFEKLANERKDAWMWSASNWQARIKEREEELVTVASQAEAREKKLLKEVEKGKAKVAELEARLGLKARYMEHRHTGGGEDGGGGGGVGGEEGGEDEGGTGNGQSVPGPRSTRSGRHRSRSTRSRRERSKSSRSLREGKSEARLPVD